VASVGRTGPQITQVPRPAEYDDEELAGKIFPGHAQSVICGIGLGCMPDAVIEGLRGGNDPMARAGTSP
jgi:hypothetical protein